MRHLIDSIEVKLWVEKKEVIGSNTERLHNHYKFHLDKAKNQFATQRSLSTFGHYNPLSFVEQFAQNI